MSDIILPKLKHFLKTISISKGESDIYDGLYERKMAELIESSEFSLKTEGMNINRLTRILQINAHPDRYADNIDRIEGFQIDILKRVNQSTLIRISDVSIKPDMEKLNVLSFEVIPIYAEWEEINTGLHKIIRKLDTSNYELDYQGIGNSSRSLLQKLANTVFDPVKHIPKDPDLPLSNGNYKNQLKTYIEGELVGKKSKKFRNLAVSSVNLVLDSIDFMNETTHKLNATRNLAELCVVSLISSINVIKIIEDKNS